MHAPPSTMGIDADFPIGIQRVAVDTQAEYIIGINGSERHAGSNSPGAYLPTPCSWLTTRAAHQDCGRRRPAVRWPAGGADGGRGDRADAGVAAETIAVLLRTAVVAAPWTYRPAVYAIPPVSGPRAIVVWTAAVVRAEIARKRLLRRTPSSIAAERYPDHAGVRTEVCHGVRSARVMPAHEGRQQPQSGAVSSERVRVTVTAVAVCRITGNTRARRWRYRKMCCVCAPVYGPNREAFFFFLFFTVERRMSKSTAAAGFLVAVAAAAATSRGLCVVLLRRRPAGDGERGKPLGFRRCGGGAGTR